MTAAADLLDELDLQERRAWAGLLAEGVVTAFDQLTALHNRGVLERPSKRHLVARLRKSALCVVDLLGCADHPVDVENVRPFLFGRDRSHRSASLWGQLVKTRPPSRTIEPPLPPGRPRDHLLPCANFKTTARAVQTPGPNAIPSLACLISRLLTCRRSRAPTSCDASITRRAYSW